MSTVPIVSINVIDEDVEFPNIRVCQQNLENIPKINKIKRKDLTEEEKNEIIQQKIREGRTDFDLSPRKKVTKY